MDQAAAERSLPTESKLAITQHTRMEAADGGGAGGGDMGLDLHPVSGAALYDLEVSWRRRQRLGRGNGNGKAALATGCAEVDYRVLLAGGFERGVVVGVSAAEVDFGVLLGLQTIAHALLFNADTSTGASVGTGAGSNNSATAQRPPRAAIVTTLAATALLPLLRDVVRAQVQAKLGCSSAHHPAVGPQVRACLERISVSQVFDVDGLWEVLGELKTPPAPGGHGDGNGDEDGGGGGYSVGGAGTAREAKAEASANGIPPESPDAPPRPPVKDRRNEREEIQDSEDEEEGLSPTPSSPPRTTTAESAEVRVSAASSDPPAESPKQEKRAAKSKEEGDPHAHVPDIILVTHFSSLLTTLFTQRDKASAHAALQLLSAHLRYLARSAGPLIMLLNSTSSLPVSSSTTTTAAATTTSSHNTNPNTTNQSSTATTTAAATNPDRRSLDQTLRSIFSPAAATTAAAAYMGYAGYAPSARTDKPAYGATFAQLLDLHLLCTQVPRTRADAEALFLPLPPSVTEGAAGAAVRYAWVVEVLLDEVGVWVWRDDDNDGDRWSGGGGKKGKGVGENTETVNRYRDKDGDKGKDREWWRRSREQRWGAVDVRGGVRIADAFPGA
ncbi:hypothetical protein DL768_009404 [Monosporascus sp. mg162]|nr:hypothetical protein DL768_009404 [Monosporascus sp. mg162]